MNKIKFYPIPETNPIPPNVVSLIGGCWGLNPTFLLWLNGREIVVQAPTDPPGFGSLRDFDEDDPFYEWLEAQRLLKVYGHYLEIIQTLLPEIEFGKTNWAYLTYQNRGGPGGYQITQRIRPIPSPTCPPWGRLIYESEIEYTVFGLASDRRGIWNGKEVDVMVGWDESHMEDVDRAMYGYRLLEGMDMTFEFYGHLVGADGKIKGIVSEAAWGRMVTVEDWPRVFRAVSEIQRRGFLYRGCLSNRFMIANNKVRLLEIGMVDPRFASTPEKLEEMAETWHWWELTELFHEIKTIGPFGNCRLPYHRFTTSYEDLECLPFPRSPERPLGGIMLYPDFFRKHFIEPWPEYVDIWDKIAEERKDVVHQHHRLDRSSAVYGVIESSYTLPTFSDEDRPLTLSRLLHRQQRRMVSYPYRQRKRQLLLLDNHDTSSVSDSTSSTTPI